jgi:Asp-tRNA(Asn)/Glu-tRNA(Gln) amidotransferase A subunit family amidase
VTSASGSRALADFVPDETSAAVDRLEAAGAVIYAKTTTSEFCYFGVTESPLNGRTSNPWNVSRTPGGSSGGAAAALAAGAGPLALGGDGGGSIRIPAAFCGVVGFKPTFGLVPREPCSQAWKSLVSYGPLARSVADARAMLLAIVGMHARDRHSLDATGVDAPAPDPRALRIAVSEDLGFAPIDDDVRHAFRATVARLESAGAALVEATPDLGSSVQTWSAIAVADARHADAAPYELQPELVGAEALRFMGYGEHVTTGQYVQAQTQRERIHRAYVDLFARTGASVLLTPALGCEAFEHGARHPAAIGGQPIEYPWHDWCGLLYDANLAGLPACAVPVGLGDDQLPVSVQLLGMRGHDGAVLAAAEAVERLVGFDAQPSTTSASLSPTPGDIQ